jgi:hypothetical protein
MTSFGFMLVMSLCFFFYGIGSLYWFPTKLLDNVMLIILGILGIYGFGSVWVNQNKTRQIMDSLEVI